MILKIGINNFNETALKELSKIENDQFKIKIRKKKDNLVAEPEILEAFIIGLSSSAAWDMLKTLFNILHVHNMKINPTFTELDKIGSIYIEKSSNINIIIQGDNSILISDEKSFKKLKIQKNFQIIEGD